MRRDMATLRSTCPHCGNVDVPSDLAHLRIEYGGRRGAYSFTCPSCASIVAKPADRKIIALLLAADVPTSHEGKEPPPPPPPAAEELPALTVDDLIAFHFELEERDVGGFLA